MTLYCSKSIGVTCGGHYQLKSGGVCLQEEGGYCSCLKRSMVCDVSDAECYLLDPRWTGCADKSVAGSQINSDLHHPAI